MKPITQPENTIIIATSLKHPAGNSGGPVWTLIRYPATGAYAMLHVDSVSVRGVDKHWAASIEMRTIRSELDLTQTEFAEKLGSTQPSVARWERGEIGCRVPVIRLARRLLVEHRESQK